MAVGWFAGAVLWPLAVAITLAPIAFLRRLFDVGAVVRHFRRTYVDRDDRFHKPQMPATKCDRCGVPMGGVAIRFFDNDSREVAVITGAIGAASRIRWDNRYFPNGDAMQDAAQVAAQRADRTVFAPSGRRLTLSRPAPACLNCLPPCPNCGGPEPCADHSNGGWR